MPPPLGGNFLQYTAWEQPGATIHSIGRWRHVTVELVGVTQLTEVSREVSVLECREGVLWLGQGLPRIRDPCSKPVRIIYFFIVAKFLCFLWRFGSCCVHVMIFKCSSSSSVLFCAAAFQFLTWHPSKRCSSTYCAVFLVTFFLWVSPSFFFGMT
jgi:hypothetical protein